MRYMKKPYEVDVLQFTPETLSQVYAFTGCTSMGFGYKEGKMNITPVINGVKLLVIQGDYIVKDNGEFLIIKPKEFELNYIPVEEEK